MGCKQKQKVRSGSGARQVRASKKCPVDIFRTRPLKNKKNRKKSRPHEENQSKQIAETPSDSDARPAVEWKYDNQNRGGAYCESLFTYSTARISHKLGTQEPTNLDTTKEGGHILMCALQVRQLRYR